MPRQPSGVVLAGGRSRRFGERDKALYPVDGTPMIRRVADRLAPVVDELVVNCREEQRAAVTDALDGCDPRMAVDAVPDRGPAYGLRTALRVATGEYAVVVACDMPFVDSTLLAYLRNRARSERADCVVPAVGGRRQPLCAVYHVDRGREACEATVARGESRLATVLACLDAVVVPEPTVMDYADERALANVNTPADLDDVAGVDTSTPDPDS